MSWSAWGWLLAAGLVEAAWTQSIKPTENFTRLWPTVICFVLGATSVYLLTKALDLVPTGTGYVVFTAIGACGAILIGALWGGEPLSALRLTGLLVIVAGVCMTHLAA